MSGQDELKKYQDENKKYKKLILHLQKQLQVSEHNLKKEKRLTNELRQAAYKLQREISRRDS